MVKQEDLLLTVEDLKTYFYLDEGIVKAVDGVSFEIESEKTFGIIGESGCGKSVTAKSILKLLPSPPARQVDGKMIYYPDGARSQGINLSEVDPQGEVIRNIRGNEISMIFQEPMSSFGPMHTVGHQIMESILIHQTEVDKKEARARTIDLLERVGIPEAEQRVDTYPHEFSGGMLQRAMIAMSLSNSPRLLIADEPTTSVDVTIEAQIIELLKEIQGNMGMSIILITHNLALVAELATEVLVMYLGKVMERGSIEDIFNNPLHPYTRALWKSIPRVEGNLSKIVPIKGVVPSPYEVPEGCVFFPRCEEAIEGVCGGSDSPHIIEVEPDHKVNCFLYSEKKEINKSLSK